MLAAFLSFALLAPFACAKLAFTLPIASTSAQGGQQLLITWQDDGKSPSLSSLGSSIDLGLYMGTQQVQTQAQDFGTVDPQTGTASFAINPNAGPNGEYFVRADTTNGTAINYSARFQIEGMTGKAPANSSTANSAPAPANLPAQPPAISAKPSVGLQTVTSKPPGVVAAVSASASASASHSSTTSNAISVLSHHSLPKAFFAVVAIAAWTL